MKEQNRSEVISCVIKVKTVDFEDLFDEGDRYFAIVTFLSILVLVKNSELLIAQSGNFEKIYLKGTDYGQ